MDPHCFDADPDPDPAQNLYADPDPYPDPGGGEGVGQPKLCIPPGKILGTPLIPDDEKVLSISHMILRNILIKPPWTGTILRIFSCV